MKEKIKCTEIHINSRGVEVQGYEMVKIMTTHRNGVRINADGQVYRIDEILYQCPKCKTIKVV